MRHNYYTHHNVGLSYRFGPGRYWGVRYYNPHRHSCSGSHFAFFYPAPVTYVYVPFGFYEESEPIYITEREEVVDDYPVEVYETEELPPSQVEEVPYGQEEQDDGMPNGELPKFGDVEEGAVEGADGVDEAAAVPSGGQPAGPEGEPDLPPPAEGQPRGVEERAEVAEDNPRTPQLETAARREREPLRLPKARKPGRFVDPRPVAGSPAVEKFLRSGSSAFVRADYEEAAAQFRLAALAIPGDAAPLFALGQSLIALGQDEYAARVIRKAIRLNPDLVNEPGDISGVYRNQEEFDRVLVALEERAADPAANTDTKFVLAVQRYFTGDPRCRDYFKWLHEAVPEHKVAEAFHEGANKRFGDADEALPPIGSK